MSATWVHALHGKVPPHENQSARPPLHTWYVSPRWNEKTTLSACWPLPKSKMRSHLLPHVRRYTHAANEYSPPIAPIEPAGASR